MIETHYTLPVSGEGCGSLRVTASSVRLLAQYEYIGWGEEGETPERLVGGLVFTRVIAFRFSDEMHSGVFPRESYDAVVEMTESSWRQQAIDGEPPAIIGGGAKNYRHYAILFSNNGFLEVLANSFHVEAPKKGGLPEDITEDTGSSRDT